jgi:hypothetical protein
VRAQVRQLSLELVQFLVKRRQPHGRAVSVFRSALQRPVLVGQGLQIDMLLVGGIEGIFFVLQLRLQTLQNLQIAGQLSRHFAYMLPFELTNLFFLVRQRLARGFELRLEKLGGVSPTAAAALRDFR